MKTLVFLPGKTIQNHREGRQERKEQQRKNESNLSIENQMRISRPFSNHVFLSFCFS